MIKNTKEISLYWWFSKVQELTQLKLHFVEITQNKIDKDNTQQNLLLTLFIYLFFLNCLGEAPGTLFLLPLPLTPWARAEIRRLLLTLNVDYRIKSSCQNIIPAKPDPGKLDLVENYHKRKFKIAKAKVWKF